MLKSQITTNLQVMELIHNRRPEDFLHLYAYYTNLSNRTRPFPRQEDGIIETPNVDFSV